MTKIFEIYFSPQNLKIYTPIERSRRAELKYIIFDLFMTFICIKKLKNHRLIIEFDLWVQKFIEWRPKLKFCSQRILNMTMENNLKKNRTKSDMTPWLNNFFKIKNEIGAWKNEKINFYPRECIFFRTIFLKILLSR